MKAPATAAAASLALLLAAAPAGGVEDEDPRAGLGKVLEAFADFDADADGRLTSDELPAAELFAILDADKDGLVTKKEIEEARLALGAGGGEKKGGGKGGGIDRRGKERGPDETFEDYARRRMAEDPRFNADVRARQALSAFDRDPRDGRVSRKEYPGANGEEVFRRFDRDDDGSLDPKEMLSLAKREIRDLGRQRSLPLERYQFLHLVDIDDDGRVTLEEYVFLSPPGSYERSPASPRRFREFDRDGDGVVTREELTEEQGRKDSRRRDASGSKSAWDLHDKDGDGRVSAEEFGGGEAVFRRLDKNRDGYLTPADA